MPQTLPQLAPAPPGSLTAVLAALPDPRHPLGWRPQYAPIPLAALLQVVLAATLCGARSLFAIAQWARERREDAPALLEALGLPPGRSPSVATLHRVLRRMDVAAYERAVGEWLLRTLGEPEEAIAIDGKSLRGIHGEEVPGVHLVSAYGQRSRVVLAQVWVENKGQELAAVRQILDQLPLRGRLVTMDALSTQRAICEQIVAAGGDYLLPVKENQPALLADLRAAFSPLGGTAAAGGATGATAGAGLDVAGVGAAGRQYDGGGGGGAQGPARAERGAVGVGAAGPGAERLRGQ
jgi:DDE_Tnp_1-associated/Transposase DDE domain